MTTTNLFPPGYDPSLDRVPPRRVGCRSLVIMLVLLLAVVSVCGGVLYVGIGAASQSGQQTPTLDQTSTATATVTWMVDEWSATGTALALITPTDTITPSPTLDEWNLTGTALYFTTQTATITPTPSDTPSPTMDYCWFLTPTATPSNTPIPVTPDGWAMTGTAVFNASVTPTAPMTATRQPPRAWCDVTPPSMIATLTAVAEFTYEVFPTFTWHPQPTPEPVIVQPQSQSGWVSQPEVIQATAEPQIFITSEVIYITQQVQQVQVIVTATPAVATPNFELTGAWLAMTAIVQATQSVTLTPSNTPTATWTASFTPSWTFSPTFTMTASETPTATFTDTPTPTPTPTPTETPTLEVMP